MSDKLDSPIEAMLISALRKVDGYVEPVQQYSVYDEKGHVRTIPDFAYPDVRLAIFCDGEQYHSDEAVRESDKKKREYLESNGWEVLAYSGKRIYADAGTCANEIHAKYSKRKGTLKDTTYRDDWLLRDKPGLDKGRHNTVSALQMFEKRYYF